VTPARRASTYLYQHAKVRLRLLLSAPLLWLGLVYIGSLLALLVTAFWTTDEYTGNTKVVWNFDNITSLFTDSLYSVVTLRTIGIALAVTVVDVLLALPIAFFMSKVAGPKLKTFWQSQYFFRCGQATWLRHTPGAHCFHRMDFSNGFSTQLAQRLPVTRYSGQHSHSATCGCHM